MLQLEEENDLTQALEPPNEDNVNQMIVMEQEHHLSLNAAIVHFQGTINGLNVKLFFLEVQTISFNFEACTLLEINY